MQFNDDPDLNDINSDITEATKLDLNEYPIEDRTRNANHWYFRLIADVAKVVRSNKFYDTSFDGTTDNGWTLDDNDGSAVHDIVAGNRFIELPTVNKPWLIYRIAYKRDGVTFFMSNPFSPAEFEDTPDNLDTNIPGDSPMHKLNGNKLGLFPIPNLNVTGGVKIWFLPEPVAFSTGDTTKVPEINTIFHKAISLGASYEKLRGKPKGETIKRDLNELRSEMIDFYSSFLDDDEANSRVDPGNYN